MVAREAEYQSLVKMADSGWREVIRSRVEHGGFGREDILLEAQDARIKLQKIDNVPENMVRRAKLQGKLIAIEATLASLEESNANDGTDSGFIC
jgi:hypothetical protein